MPTKIVKNYMPYVGSSHNSKVVKKHPGIKLAISPKVRSKTFPGIAQAMADQWSEPFFYQTEINYD